LKAKTAPIVSIGDLVADLVVSIPSLPAEAGRHQVANDLQLSPGGSGNFLIAGARLGQPMAALGALGDDRWGHSVAEIISTAGVDLSLVRYTGTTTVVIVLVGQSGDHVFLGKIGEAGKIALCSSETALIRRAGALFCAGYTLGEAHQAEWAIEAMRVAQAAGVPVFFDPGPQLAAAPDALRAAALPLIDVLLTTEDEISLLGRGTLSETLSAGPATVVVKRGAAGCAIYSRGQVSPLVELAGHPVPVIDTSAAGDSFDAAFVAAWVWGWPLAACAQLANAAGTAKIQKLGGGLSVPTLAEVRAVIERFSLDIKI
jgi:sugar/nucleoside kinase (ribokinase family)